MKNKEEFIEYIKTFNKKPGEYTSDELYRIGSEHKQLKKNDKNWKSLAEIVGYAGTGEQYRQFVNYQQRKTGVLECADRELIVENHSQYEEAYKQKTEIRDIYNEYRANIRSDARQDRFYNALVDAVKASGTYPATHTAKKRLADSAYEAILLFSDLHLGVECDNFYNTYNKDVAYARLKKLANDVIQNCYTNHVWKLNVVDLGDDIHGIIHTNGRLNSELNLTEQIVEASKLIAWFLNELDETPIQITFRSCTDNHSRAVANKDENLEGENFSKIIYELVKLRLNSSDIDFIEDNIDESIGKFYLENGKCVMFAHGHLDSTNKCIDAFSGATREFIDYVLLSHFHSGKEKSYNGSKLIVNGSIVGTEQYAISRRLFDPAMQKLLIFQDENMIDISIDLQGAK